jgi:hypothetical protein
LPAASPKVLTRGFHFFFSPLATPLFPRTVNRVVGVSTQWYWANEIPVVEHCCIKSLHATGNVPSHLNEVDKEPDRLSVEPTWSVSKPIAGRRRATILKTSDAPILWPW